MAGEREFLLSSPGEDLIIRVHRAGAVLSGEQLELARRAVFELSIGLQSNQPDHVALAQQLDQALFGHSTFAERSLTASEASLAFASALERRLGLEFERGRLLVERRPRPQITTREPDPEPELPPLPPRARERKETFFEVRFVDEIGRAINRIDVDFVTDESTEVATNAAGVALLEGVTASSAKVSVVSAVTATRLRPSSSIRSSAKSAPSARSLCFTESASASRPCATRGTPWLTTSRSWPGSRARSKISCSTAIPAS